MQDFFIGAATAAHQVEGNNIHSDYWVGENVKHSDYVEPSGMAVDHYHRFGEDIALLAKAGGNAYRFSIEWARIEPEEGQFNRSEVEHYRKVLACCKANGITPIVTLHHFSSPAWLISRGGWGKEYVVSAFARYAGSIAEELGSEFGYVCTINEANMGFQLHKVIDDMRKAGKKKEGAVQVGTNNGLDLKKIVDADGAREPEAGAPLTQMGYEDYPAAVGNVVRKVAREFSGELIVTENGIGSDSDTRRCEFIKEAFAGVMAAKKDGANVRGYLYWSLLDNFEWQAGYAKTFGLIAVDRETQTRYPKESLKVLGSLTKC